MTSIDLITDLFCRIDDRMKALPKHPQATLWPSEVVTLGVLHALKGVGNRAFYRWLTRDYQPLFPHLPEWTLLFRQFKTHRQCTLLFLAPPTLLGVVDSYGIELIHPLREGRSPARSVGRDTPIIDRSLAASSVYWSISGVRLSVGWGRRPTPTI